MKKVKKPIACLLAALLIFSTVPMSALADEAATPVTVETVAEEAALNTEPDAEPKPESTAEPTATPEASAKPSTEPTAEPSPKVTEEPTESEVSAEPEATAEPTAEPENKKSFNDYGELLDLTETDGICVLKYKITSSATKKMTVNQNYYTVVNFIKDGGGDQYDEIQYWAVADMQDGSESKVISFTVSKDLIEKIKDGTVLPTKMGDYVDEL